MFLLTHLRRELRRRLRQSIVICLGLAVGVGLVVVVTATAAGVRAAQGSVLHSLYGVGTDLAVSGPTPRGPAAYPLMAGGFPAAGKPFRKEALVSRGLGTLPASSVTAIGRLKDVATASGTLALTDIQLSGTLPSLPGGFGSAAAVPRGSIHTTTFQVDGVDTAMAGSGPLAATSLAAGHGFTASDADADVAVLDSGYAAQNNLRPGDPVTVRGTTFKVVGTVTAPPGGAPADIYLPLAKAQQIAEVGSSENATATLAGQVNIVYVSAASSADIPAVQAEIARRFPSAVITTSSSLAGQVTGSLASASTLASNLGRWLAIAVLAAAFGVTSLLMAGAVGRRVREFGTLKALGWPTRRIVAQVMSESLALGAFGGVAGAGLGFAAAALVSGIAPAVPATLGTPAAPGSATNGIGGISGRVRTAVHATRTVAVHLTAPVSAGSLTLAILLAVTGGLIAGSLASWRAARLPPAAALAHID
jgi:putative ABC transport system permease protein